ncbi:hypothetical protein H6S82_08970 [Planktothrix sp. FACHB-1355]|uniref:Uncharacterized protein n=1 Tax=Aerosakkonema funiforme FACHB-1375 TaxID=2949571 RepID=A0A926VJK0_9CYAN|nr:MULTISPECIES: hypothetical protein [Oscillatoriales]MBD2185026.1 hypothetical protein [Aerosakkonema funiforme FACHB-1375]MBD3558987.1 hypothetical protein [Planktothrix sp. FACHB-1355]
MQGKQIKHELDSLIRAASSVDPCLAKKLDEINRWIKDVKPGSVTAKKFLTAFLLQLIADARVWLSIKALAETADRELAFEQMTPTEKYWYTDLFAKWLNENDPKFYIWRQKLMAEEFNQPDAKIIQSLAEHIIQRGGTVWHCYIADLSMATDLIVSYRQKVPLCLQVTSLGEEFSQEKYDSWKNTLEMWEIDRGLFLSYNPGLQYFVTQLVNLALYNSDNLKAGSYIKFP